VKTKALFLEDLEDLGSFDEFVNEHFPHSKLFILCDENTQEHCLPLLDNTFGGKLADAELILIEAGEASKDLEVYQGLVETLVDLNAERNALLINVGGGVVCDLGAFVASTFKRGIPFINIPTSLLAMVDAAWGGKNGVNLGPLKNQIGTFSESEFNIVCPTFLNSLPDEELISGKAEMLKHGLISNPQHYREVEIKGIPNLEAIKASIKVKMDIVAADPHEKGQRKLLNFGHSLGHAFESYAASKGDPISHGQAVLAGMICEVYLSETNGLAKSELQEIVENLRLFHKPIKLELGYKKELKEFLQADKKRQANKHNFSLLSTLGAASYNRQLSSESIDESIDFYTSVYS